MNQEKDPFRILTGSDKIGNALSVLILLAGLAAAGWFLSITGITGGIILIFLPFLLIFGYLVFSYPVLGVYTSLVLSFILLGMIRYLPGVQVGLAMDGILIFTYIALIFNKFYEKVDWTPARRDITLLAFIWFVFTLLQFFNPEARSHAAWLTGFRGIGLYMFLLVPLVLLLINDRRKLDIFLYLWAGLSILASVKGIVQNFIGTDPFEKQWLAEGGAVTHVIFGKLRIFSFMSDAGQFGANQAYSAVVFSIIGLSVRNRKIRFFYLVTALLGFYGMFLSGTRGAISVPLTGFFIYAFLRRNRFVTISGILALIAVFVFFKYTTIGQSNYQIRRMRSAFNLDDPSFKVRLENQKKLKVYLASRPFGGGIGHAGVKARRFLPDAFLSGVATDSWYVLIWAETGIVGLILHLSILFYIVARAGWLILMKLNDHEIRIKMAALTAGMTGVLVASYGNAVLGTMPTSILVYASMAIVLNAIHYDRLNGRSGQGPVLPPQTQ